MKIGANDITALYLGSTEIQKAYLGSTLVWDVSSVPAAPVLSNEVFDWTPPVGSFSVDVDVECRLYVGRYAPGTNPDAATIIAGTGALEMDTFDLTSGTNTPTLTFDAGLDGNFQLSVAARVEPNGDPSNVVTSTGEIDTLADSVLTSTPTDGGTDFATDGNIIIDMEDDVSTAGTIVLEINGGATIETFTLSTGSGDNGGTVALGSASLTTDRITINPGANLVSGTLYDLTLTGLEDEAGNAFTGDLVISFTTASDVSAPTLSSSSPADNATDVAVDTVIDLVFNETVTLETGNIVLRDNDGGFADLETFNVATGIGDNGGTVVLATTSVTNDTVRITPGADLANNIEHAIRVAATAIDDLSGNSFAGITDDTTVSFTTEAAAAFSPADLFAGAEDGFIFAPGDTALNSMWQENDGTRVTAVADGDIVGEILCNTTGRWVRSWLTGQRPTYVDTGGVKSVAFGPTESGFGNFSSDLTSNYAVYVAIKVTGDNNEGNGFMQFLQTSANGASDGLQMCVNDFIAGTPNTWNIGLFDVTTFVIDGPANPFDEGTFYRIAADTPDTGSFYVDGVLDANGYNDCEGTGSFSIGYSDNLGGRHFNGEIAFLLIIDRALTPTEIANLDTYASGRIV